MTTRLGDPRKHTRILMNSGVEWRSGLGAGEGEILDTSRCGAGFTVPVREAFQIGPSVALDLGLESDDRQRLTDDARVTYKIPTDDGKCRIGVEFSVPAEAVEAQHEVPILRFMR